MSTATKKRSQDIISLLDEPLKELEEAVERLRTKLESIKEDPRFKDEGIGEGI